MSYTELHFHLLPGVDDGPSSIEESVALAAAAAKEGTRTIVATPHIHPAWPTDVRSLPARVEEVEEHLRRERVRIRVICGAELSHEMVGGLSQGELDVISNGPEGKPWLLLEASLAGLDDGFTSVAEELRDRGFAVVVAHPERSLVGADASPATGPRRPRRQRRGRPGPVDELSSSGHAPPRAHRSSRGARRVTARGARRSSRSADSARKAGKAEPSPATS